MIIGIDFSINSTAFTIKNDSGDYQWFVPVPITNKEENVLKSTKI